MATPFTNTTRSLRQDRFDGPIIFVLLLSIILALWLYWMLASQIALYQRSHSAYLRSGQTVIAEFPVEALRHIAVAQPAQVLVDGYARAEFGTLAATVTFVKHRAGEPLVEVRLTVVPNANIRMQKGQTGVVEIQTESLAPATLLLRSLSESGP